MELKELKPRQALNKSFLKIKPNREDIDKFKANLIDLLDNINDKELEEFHKNLVIKFLQKTYYDPQYFINTKGRNDLVIHNGNSPESFVGVIIETKKPTNRAEMVTTTKINAKAFQELVLYYLQERITNNNIEIKYLIATNINEWFIFDAKLFDRLFAQNENLVKQFTDFKGKRLADTNTDFFYKQIAEPFIEGITSEIKYTYFNIQDFQKPLRNSDKADDNSLIALFKLLSPEHLLKLPFINDRNTLDEEFYSELLHIIGLAETKEGTKKLIDRNNVDKRNTGTILEDAIIQLDSLDKISRLENPSHFGNTEQERLFNVALELTITWINRILFLKLLEAQLITYHKGDKSYAFLSLNKIKTYDDLNSLFFQVLAKKIVERNSDVKKIFDKVPYLNSSLFEPTNLEHGTLFISNLNNDKRIPIISSTVLKDQYGKKRTGELLPLEYLFEFLNAYDFSSEGSEEIQEDSKTLINASVLGLIFEKINGYKDGAFFTPGFITMYMCREAIRKAILQKFNEYKTWNCKNWDDLYDAIDFNTQEGRNEANKIINELKICDPAVGSGHFLVSALNELIAVKNDLKILQDRTGKRLKEYQVEIVNDELIVTDGEGELFNYKPSDKEKQRIQETLFHEKQTIIENCLFGVDINPNSVKICRLRLWIELLKNAYYKNSTELETLPNIDINIKCGNSLVSRFAIDADLSQALKKSKWTIDNYRIAVDTYKNAESKDHKREMEKLIAEIKSDFRSEIETPFKKKIRDARGKAETLATKILNLKMFGEKADKGLLSDHKKASDILTNMETERDIILNNKIFENAFEWRFEFPEVLNTNGDFIGFDLVIGNPPYVYRNADIENVKEYFNSNYYNTSGNYDLYKFFMEQSIKIVKNNGFNSLITNSSFLLQTSFDKTRKFLLENSTLTNIVPLGGSVFQEATVDSAIYILQKSKYSGEKTLVVNPKKPIDVATTKAYTLNQDRFLKNEFFVFDYLLNDIEYNIVNKLISDFPKIETAYDFGVGVNTGYIKDDLTSDSKIDERYHPMVPGTGVSKYGKIKTEGFIMYDKEFVKSKGKLGRTLPDEKYFIEPKILIVRTRNISLKERIIASIDYDKKYNLNRISNIISKDNNSLEGLLGVLNSKLFNWLYTKRYFDYEIKPIYLRNSPLCNTNDKELNRLVKEIIQLRSFDQNANISNLTDAIDNLVYKLYDLTADEIKIVENNVDQ